MNTAEAGETRVFLSLSTLAWAYMLSGVARYVFVQFCELTIRRAQRRPCKSRMLCGLYLNPMWNQLLRRVQANGVHEVNWKRLTMSKVNALDRPPNTLFVLLTKRKLLVSKQVHFGAWEMQTFMLSRSNFSPAVSVKGACMLFHMFYLPFRWCTGNNTAEVHAGSIGLTIGYAISRLQRHLLPTLR